MKKFITMNQKLFGSIPSNSTLSDRIKIQKIAYLFQEKGLDLNLDFFWYIHGVFSYELWKDTVSDISEVDISSVQLTSSDLSVFSDLRNVREVMESLDSDKLELVSSILYWSNKYSKNINEPDIVDIVRAYKPRFSVDEVKYGVVILERLGFNSH